MKQEATRWPPVVGDVVRIKDSQLRGNVIKTKGVSETRFRLQVPSQTADGVKLSPGLARAARIASHWYGLDELEPVPTT
jgi:hypothetical protein